MPSKYFKKNELKKARNFAYDLKDKGYSVHIQDSDLNGGFDVVFKEPRHKSTVHQPAVVTIKAEIIDLSKGKAKLKVGRSPKIVAPKRFSRMHTSVV